MNIKALVNLALENRTPNEKVAFMCLITGRSVDDYAHLDNGRKSMTAGNVLRGACKDVDTCAKMIAAAGLSDLDIDALPGEAAPAPKKTPAARPAAKPLAAADEADDEPAGAIRADTKDIVRVSPDVYFSAYALTPAYLEGCK